MSEPTAESASETTAERPGLLARSRDLVGDSVSVVVAGARLWAGHWPLLLTVALLGGAGRMGAIWGAIEVSEVSPTLGFAVLALAPLSSVAAIVVMLHLLRDALPSLAAAGAVRAPDDVTSRRERHVVDVLASVLVPFLAVYASYGLLAEDRFRYQNGILGREFYTDGVLGGGTFDGERFFAATGVAEVVLVAVAVVLRWGLARLDGRLASRGRPRPRPLAFGGAYVEVFWMTALAGVLVHYKDRAWAWAESRRAVDVVVDAWLRVLDVLGPLGRPVDTVVDGLLGVVAAVDGLVVVPVAWLAVGAVVYGHRLAAPPRRVRTLPGAARVPVVVRRWGLDVADQVVGDLRSRFSALASGLRQLAVAGLGPMLVFALVFLVVGGLEDALAVGVRQVVGPQDLWTWLSFAPHVETVTRAVGLTVTAALLAAAVDRVLAPSVGQSSANDA
ncbi:hypothetical protein [Cellulomonas carbonis]|uniref:Uncharacterized protein n=1 Tax=Cellulomonas carbonis T26 TaxID=947969 RepID=A0A0A0BPX4_9CELL|nr:hypothetical protein [Cellulomonas carbonis]KGM09129.1 hypothetical protein N868_04375 [Cellulomonas carbonis T26]GGB96060.1 hypothetical protein GCM10010972_06000 [Cellulomonas carbonis]